MIYREKFNLLWHDTDRGHEVRPSAVLAYLQETANRQFLTHAVPLDELYEKEHLGFLLSRIAIRFDSPLFAYETVDTETWTAGGLGCSFFRGFRMTRNGDEVAYATSVWALADARDRRLLRVSEAPMQFGDEPVEENTVPLRFRIPRDAELREVGVREIRHSDLDFNGHMNNTRYPDMLCDFSENAASERVTELSISFLKEAPAGARIRIFRADDGNIHWFRTQNEAGEVCIEARTVTEPRTRNKEIQS